MNTASYTSLPATGICLAGIGHNERHWASAGLIVQFSKVIRPLAYQMKTVESMSHFYIWLLCTYHCCGIILPCDVPSLDIISSVFSLKHLRCRPCAKVVYQIPEGSDCFGCLIPRVCPPPPPILGENIDRYIEFKFYLKLVFPFDYPFWTSLRTRCDSVSPVFSLWLCWLVGWLCWQNIVPRLWLCTKYSTPAMCLCNL